MSFLGTLLGKKKTDNEARPEPVKFLCTTCKGIFDVPPSVLEFSPKPNCPKCQVAMLPYAEAQAKTAEANKVILILQIPCGKCHGIGVNNRCEVCGGSGYIKKKFIEV